MSTGNKDKGESLLHNIIFNLLFAFSQPTQYSIKITPGLNQIE